MKTFLGLALFLFILPGISAAAVQTKIYQCANYKAGTGDHDTCEQWINGNINEQKAFYFEGDVVAYRLHLKGLAIGHSYTATIEWDGTQGDKNALDYIATVNRTVDNADPCQDLAIIGCDKDTPDSTWLIPVDDEVEKGRNQISEGGYPNGDDIDQETPHHFRMWNGDITAVGSYSYDPISFDYLSSTQISTTITFTANAADVLMAWGGHISTRQDWGEADSAINISGSPYHMRLLTVVDHDDGDDIVASGNRDLQLSASAVFFPISLTIEKTTDRDTSDWFNFTTNLVSPDDAFSLQRNSTKTLVITEDTTINVTETELGSLWGLDSIVCDDLTTQDVDDQSFTLINADLGVSLTLTEGAIVKCTFHNIFTGEPLLVVEKKVIVEEGDCGTVDFDETDNEQLDIASGDTVKYCYRVRNTGDAAAYNLALEDDAAGLSASFPVALSGGDIATLDGVGILNDLDVGGQTFGEALVAINEPTGTTAINTATADADAPAEPVTDTAQVDVVDQADCALNATVTTTTCPGSSNVIDVVAGTAVTWCAEICWPSNANSSLTIGATGVELLDGNEDPLDPAVTTGDFTIDPGNCAMATLPEDLGTDSVARILRAAGSDGFDNDETCQATAAADIYNPDIAIDKKVSLDDICGNGDDADSLEVYTGTDVWYCFTVSNDHEGAEGLSSVQFNDALLSLVDVTVGTGSLASGEVWNSTAYGPYPRTAEVSNTATVTGEGEFTETPVSDSDTAIVTVVHADVIVEKSGTSALDVEQGESDIEYVIFVWNGGNTTAIDVELADALPEAFDIDESQIDSRCSYDALDHDLTCELGDIEPGLSNGKTINVYGTLVPESGYDPLVNGACAYPDNNLTPDVNLSNNCDDTTTRITTGATRTIGWWGNHPDMMGACLEANDDLIEVLGFVELATVENAIGIIKTNIAHDLCKGKRDPLVKAQLQAGRQVLAAFCNVNYLGAAEPVWMDDAQATLEGDDIAEILALGGLADEFNNNGDEEPLPIGISPEHANPHFAWTDPTSPEECPSENNGNGPKSGEGSGGCSIGSGNGFDPLLPLMVLIAVAYLWHRRRENA